jgi:hypothetical protein
VPWKAAHVLNPKKLVHEQPRIFFLHYWGTGNAEKLAKGLRFALDQTGKKNTLKKSLIMGKH